MTEYEILQAQVAALAAQLCDRYRRPSRAEVTEVLWQAYELGYDTRAANEHL